MKNILLQEPNLSQSEDFFYAVAAKFMAQSRLFYYKLFFQNIGDRTVQTSSCLKWCVR
jgi:hypothetical protein